MSLADCIQRAIAGGAMNPARARDAQALFDQRLGAHAHLGAGAEAAAAEDVWRMLRKAHITGKRGELMQAAAQIRLIDDVSGFTDSSGNANAAGALHQLLEWGQSAKFQGVKGTADALTSQYMRGISDFVGQHSRTVRSVLKGKVRNRALLPNIVRELHGEASGDAAAKAMADGISKALEMARLDFNAAGGAIGRLQDFGLPHNWDQARVARVAVDDWAADIFDRLDWDRIVDFDTDLPMSGSGRARQIGFLKDIHRNITTQGWAVREPSGIAGGRRLGRRHADHRVLHFKSADDWMAMNEAYGRSDAFSSIVSHLQVMARDTALMRVLGPNPRAGLEFAAQTAEKLATERGWKLSWRARSLYSSPLKEAQGQARMARRMYDLYTGTASNPEADVVAAVGGGTRQFLIAAQLGGATLSAVSDVGFMGMAARHVGMDWNKVIGRQMRAIASSGQRALMVRTGIIADSAANTGVVQARMLGESYGPAMTERLSEFTMRASGLTAWTDIARGSFRLEFYGFLADNARLGWDALPKPLRELVFGARGITRADWDDIRATTLFRDAAEPDAAFLIPGDIRYRTDLDPERGLDLSLKLEAAILEQMEFAVPSASLRGRAMFWGGAPGTLPGEILNSSAMYKSFALSIAFNQLGRVFFHKVNGNRLANIAMLATITTVMGAFSVQMKDLARGRNPRPMNSTDFLLAAVSQGGGLGILGDFAFSSQNRFGGGLGKTLAGPAVGFVGDSASLIGAIMGAITSGEDKDYDKLGRLATKFINQYSGPTNLWYANAAIDRLVWDNLQEWLDSDAATAWRRAEKRRAREGFGASFWPQGQPLPDLPDLTSALGGTK